MQFLRNKLTTHSFASSYPEIAHKNQIARRRGAWKPISLFRRTIRPFRSHQAFDDFQTDQQTHESSASESERGERTGIRRPQRSGDNGRYQRDSNTSNGSEVGTLGLTELLAPRAVAKFIGVDRDHAGLIRVYGMREIASDIAIFSAG